MVNVSNPGIFTVDLAPGGSDHLVVNGTELGETIAVTGTAVAVGALETVNYTGAETLTVNGRAGNDTFTVTPSLTTSIFIDGGDPDWRAAGRYAGPRDRRSAGDA